MQELQTLPGSFELAHVMHMSHQSCRSWNEKVLPICLAQILNMHMHEALICKRRELPESS